MKVKIKKLVPEASIPQYMKPGDGGMDLVATSKIFDEHGNCVYGTGIAINIPLGYVGLIFPRSSNSKKDLILANSVGVVDPGCQEEIVIRYKPSGYFASIPNSLAEGTVTENFDFICFGKEDVDDEDNVAVYNIGDRIGQLIIVPRPQVEWEEIHELSITERGERGFGSTNVSNGTGEGFQGSHLL